MEESCVFTPVCPSSQVLVKRESMGVWFGKDTTEMNFQNSAGVGTSCCDSKPDWEGPAPEPPEPGLA